MNFINPFGRSVGDGMQARACMCNTSSNFASGKSTSDSCFNCGCACGSDVQYKTGNRVKAFSTIRAS